MADYEKYTHVEPTEITNDLKIGMPYGELPPGSIESKFEMTDDYNPEGDYEDFARKQLVDRRPDEATMEYEKPRKSLASKGYLNLIHSGNRGGSEPNHSEIFLEDTWGDPRGIAVDPDMKELKRQHEARMRFVRWSADADNSVPSGRWSEAEAMRKQQEVFRQIKPRMAWFTTSKDGRKQGVSKVFKHESDMRRVDKTVQAYGDIIQQYAENPQRATTILSNSIIARTKMYQQNTSDHEFQVAKYGMDNRKLMLTKVQQPLKYTDLDGHFEDCDKTHSYKAMGILMSQIVKNKHEAHQDSEYGKTDDAQIRKSEAVTRDLAIILQSIAQDGDFQDGDKTQTGKSAKQKLRPHDARVTSPDAYKPAHHLLNAERIYKSVKEGGDPRKAKDNVVTDDRKADVRDSKTVAAKTAQATSLHQKKGVSHVEVEGESKTPHNYKTAKAQLESKTTSQNPENVWSASDDTQTRKTQTAEYDNPSTEDVEQQAQFYDNSCKERRIAPMGDKYMARNMRRDGSLNEGVGDF